MSQTSKLVSRVSLSGLLAVGATNALAHSPLLCEAYLRAFGTPVQDGVLAENEYKSCTGPITTPGTVGTTDPPYTFNICATNDIGNIYYAVSISDRTNDANDFVGILFDDEHDGTVKCAQLSDAAVEQVEDDRIGFLSIPENPQGGIFVDSHYCFLPGVGFFGQLDQSQDGFGVRAFTAGSGQIYEFSHPLASGGSDDYELKVHDRVGWCLSYRNSSAAASGGGFTFPPGCSPDDTSLYGDVTIENILFLLQVDFVPLTCEVQEAKITHGEGGAALSGRLKQADLLLGSVTGLMTTRGEFSLPASGPAKHLLQASIEEARAFIREVNEYGGEIDANNGRGTAARWIGQAEATIAKIEKLSGGQ